MSADRTAANGLFLLDGQSFADHKQGCDRCIRYVEADPKTLALLCLDGAVLLEFEHKPQPKPRAWIPADDTRVSKKVAQAAMRYK